MPQPSPIRQTERRNPRSSDIDTLEIPELVSLFCAEDRMVPEAVLRSAPELIAAVGLVENAFRNSGRLFYVGAGTSGRLGVLDASECPPTFGTPPELVQGVIAGGSAALTQSVEGAEDSVADGAEALTARSVCGRDVVVGIAASGSTPFVVGALEHARKVSAKTVFVTCTTPDEAAINVADVIVQLDVGPELVTGSTRLKAGTATKLVLNILTTCSLVRTGKTYGNLMVDLQARNAKLHDRGERIVMEVLNVDRETARKAIDAAAGSIKTAIVMAALGLDYELAEQRLSEVDGRLRGLIGNPPPVGADG